jgi:glutamate 5-kinase
MHSSTFRLISEVVTNLKNDGYSVAIVCSGALAIGMKRMGLICKPADLNERKACPQVALFTAFS